jgi:FeS assembly SUF system protein
VTENRADLGSLETKITDALRTIFDPEIPVNIYDLGLIYEVDMEADRNIKIKMTLTSPNCPAAEILPGEVQSKIETIPGVSGVEVEIVWDPPWSPDMMSDAAKLELGFM